MPMVSKLLLLLLAIFGAIMAQADPRVLVYTATFGYRHDSIPTAIEVLRQQGPQYNVSFDFTEDPNKFTQDNLANYDGVLFVSNSEEVLNDTGKAAFQDWLQKGGVFAGAHSASACLFNTSFFNATVGALFDYHPDLQSARHLMNGLLWALDGKTTRAYNTNALVGNATLSANSASTTTSATLAAPSSASQSADMTSTGTTGPQSRSTAPAASPPAASSTANGASGKTIAGGAVALAVAGAALIGL
ncbi:hypothetical protein QFC21_002061 [Naganishia friedmannii]|uniref:Uncharacterized protein n=1 Tax=Naganishia friedmannii TaxID=89922 RepID=A0ACC2VZE2_9TREE|nr:hypothetical protein QFC21_002061 [Naganishia friedmannii]